MRSHYLCFLVLYFALPTLAVRMRIAKPLKGVTLIYISITLSSPQPLSAKTFPKLSSVRSTKAQTWPRLRFKSKTSSKSFKVRKKSMTSLTKQSKNNV